MKIFKEKINFTLILNYFFIFFNMFYSKICLVFEKNSI